MSLGSSSRVVRNLGCAAGLAASALLAWLLAGPSSAQEHRPAPPFEGKSIPEPPEQGKAWAPPETRLPKFLVTATDALFQQGVADPRGCEYREVEIGDGVIAEAHAFVLPERADAPGRFVVGWDGQVYPATAVGEPADLDRDIRELAESLKATEPTPRTLPRALSKFQDTVGSRANVGAQGRAGRADVATPGAFKLCMLLRLGRADLAEALFAAGTTWTPEPRARDLTDYGISYQTLAVEWASTAFARLVSAHRRADDAIALHVARKLAKFRDLAAARMDEMGFPREPQRGPAGPEPGPNARFFFLGQVDALLADHERRAVEAPRGPVPPKGGDPAPRVAALIRDLDQIAEVRMSSPGSANPGSSPLVRALFAEGDAAVEPLLKALESDERLTRTITNGRSFLAVDAYVHPVVEAVFPALTGILRTREFNDRRAYGWTALSLADRKALADEMRQYWERNRAIPLVERWYKLLLDDSAGPARWAEAVDGIVGTDAPMGVHRKPGTGPSMGEPLRDGRAPSVSELMARRARELARSGTPGSSPRDGLRRACGIATSLAAWDERASLPLLQELSRQCRAALDLWRDQKDTSPADQSLITHFAEFTTIRARLGDAGALDEYADWLRTTTPKMLENAADRAFKPLVAAPDHPALAEAARWLFTDPASPWTPILPEARGERSSGYRDLTSSALLVVPAFREAVITGLADMTPIGTVSMSAEGQTVRKMKNGSTTTSSPSLVEKEEGIAPGVEGTVRRRDLLASNIAKIGGAPRFEMLWPEERRDQAAAACVEFLRRYGPRFEADDASPFDVGVSVTFPILGRPATREDVDAARAIFSLEGEVRTVNLPGFPQEARWLTLKDSPRVSQVIGGPLETRYQTDGRVWQAEEVREGDRWVRYFGFVGRHTIGKALASEVEFGPQYGFWRRLGGGLNARLELVPTASARHGMPPPSGFDPGHPITLVMHIQNQLGTEQTSPTEFLRPAPDGKPALRKGITLKLASSKPTGSRAARWQPLAPEPREPSKRQADFEPTDASRVLAPAESFEALRIDLNDWFDLPAPGLYSVSVSFAPEAGLGDGYLSTYDFQVGGE